MKLKYLLIAVVALALGLGAGYGFRYLKSQPHTQVEQGDFQALYATTGTRVILYSLTTCPYCKDARTFLTQANIEFSERVVDESEAAKAEAKSLGATRVPFILIGNQSLTGYDEDLLTELLREEGLWPN